MRRCSLPTSQTELFLAGWGQTTVAGDGAGQIVSPARSDQPAAHQIRTAAGRHGRDRPGLACDRRGGRIVTVAAEGRLDHPDVVLDVDAPVTDLLMLQNGLLAIATQYGVAVVKVAVAGWPGPAYRAVRFRLPRRRFVIMPA